MKLTFQNFYTTHENVSVKAYSMMMKKDVNTQKLCSQALRILLQQNFTDFALLQLQKY